MRKEIISEKEGIALLLLFTMNGSLILPTGVQAQKDIWIAIILAMSLGVLISLVYIKILQSFPGKDLFDISEILFGRFLGKVFNLLYAWFAFHVASIIFVNFGYFLITVSLPETSKFIIVIFPAILCIWGLKLGIEGMGRFSQLVLMPLLIIIFLAIFLAIPEMNFENLLPVFENGLQPVFKGAFSVFAFPFAEAVILMGVFNCFRDNKSLSKVYVISIIVGGIVLLLTKISDVAVLGIRRFSDYYFPSYYVVSRISIAHFIERIEIIVGLTYAVGALVKVTLCMLAVCKGISKIFSFDDYRFLVTPMVLLNVTFAFITNKDIIQLTSWTTQAWRYYAFPFQVILPLIMLILSFIKSKPKNMMKAK